MNRKDVWISLPWKQFQTDTFRLQKRIAQAAIKGDHQSKHSLQRLLLNSHAAKCIAVKRVAQQNRGKDTAGIDGLRSLTSSQCLKLANTLDLNLTRIPVRRVWIPKPGKTELRPLGIPAMRDRCQQMLVKLALDPEWEPCFEGNSYGFRPGRNCADAMIAVWNGINKAEGGKFVLDADIRGCFDNIDHGALLKKIATIAPTQKLIAGWLKAGIMDGGRLERAKAGTPQGGVISPLLCNIALHGLEHHVTGSIRPTGEIRRPILIRYADDFVVLHKDRGVIDQCKAAAEQFLKLVGLELSATKTSVRHTSLELDGKEPGFEFLGFNFRCHPVSARQKPKGRTRSKALVRPSRKSIAKIYDRLCSIVDQSRALSQSLLIIRLNPVIRG